MRIGIYGGSFDPVHIGHLLVAEHCLEAAGLDRIDFLPAHVSPLKDDVPPIDAKHRLAMLRLAIGGHAKFQIDDREIRRGDVSYTVDTLAEMASEKKPEDELILIVGADSLISFDKWREPDRILQLAELCVAERGGHDMAELNLIKPFLTPQSLHPEGGQVVPGRQIEISSSEIRRNVGRGKSIRYQTPAAVVAYMNQHKLYL